MVCLIFCLDSRLTVSKVIDFSALYATNPALVLITGLLFVCIFHRVVFIFLAACLKLGVIAAFLYCIFLLGAAK